MRNALLLALLLSAPSAVLAAEDAPPADFSAAFWDNYHDAADKLVQLAEAIPADKYGWRPMEGVRSVSEVLVHVAGANYFLSGALGVAPPEGLSRDMEKTVTDKAAVIDLLKKSFEHVKQAVDGTSAAALGEQVNAFGRSFSKLQVLLIIGGHAHEHLGQSIAYARSNGVVPPWSQPSGGP